MRIFFAIAALSVTTSEAVTLRREEDSLAQTAIEADVGMLGALAGAMGGGGGAAPPPKPDPPN